MKGKTHLFFAIFISVFLINYVSLNEYIMLTFCLAIGSLIPDMDTAGSIAGRRVKLFSYVLEHRGFFHSLFFPLFFVGLYLIYDVVYFLYVILGILSHIFLDSLTKKGVKPFFPLNIKIKGNMKTGSFSETLLNIFFLVVFVIVLVLKF